MSRKKAGLCKCTHEIKYWHDVETGRCAYGSGFNGAGEPHPPRSLVERCPCVRKVKGKKTMTPTPRTTTQAITVRRESIIAALDKLHEAARATQRAGELLAAAGGESTKAFHALRVELLGMGASEMPAILRDAPTNGVSPTGVDPHIREKFHRATATDPIEDVHPAFDAARSLGEADSLGKGERLTMIAVAQSPKGATRDQIMALTGYASRSVSTYLSALRGLGFVDVIGGANVPTHAGIAELGAWTPIETGLELLEHRMREVGKGEATILGTLARKGACTSSELCELTTYAKRSMSTYTSTLRARRFIVKKANRWALVPELVD